MNQNRKLAGAAAAVLALSFLSLPITTLAHGESDDEAAELQQNLDEYAGEINDLIATVEGIVAEYEPGENYDDEVKELIKQWESVDFHETLEENAMALYPPIWSALGAFSTALKEGAAVETVRARRDAIAAALWQGYGALKLLAARDESGAATADEEASESDEASGGAVIQTINAHLDRVLALYKKGESEQARELIFDTYMQYFEGIEGDLIEQDAELVSGLEADFNATLPQLIKSGAPVSEVAEQIDDMQDDLDDARELLEEAEQEETSVF